MVIGNFCLLAGYCENCRYAVKQRTGDDACPFNYFYRDSMARNAERLRDNRRMTRTYATLDRMEKTVVADMRASAGTFLAALPSSGDY